VRLTAIAKGHPDATTARVSDAFSEASASIVDVHFFAGVVTVLTFELAPESAGVLGVALARAGVDLDQASLAALERAASATDEVTGTLAITFAHGDPNRRHEVPAVPGR
jgi:hypothetical protein